VKVGIHSLDVAMPLGRMTVEHMAAAQRMNPADLLEQIGVYQKPVLEDGEEIFPYGARVAKKVIEAAGISPKDIGVVVFGSCGVTNRQMWSPAAWIQNQVGAVGACAFDIQNGCNSGNIGLQIASSILSQHTTRPFGLLVVADQLSKIIDYTNAAHKKYFSFADGTAAILISKTDYRYEIGSFSSVTKGEYADNMWLERTEGKLWMKADEEEEKLLTEEYRTEYPQRVRRVLEKEGLTTADINHIFMNQADHKLLPRLAVNLDISLDKIHASYRNHGHLGGSDIYLGLKTRETEGKIKQGDRLLLSSSAFGFSWGSSLLTKVKA